MDCKEAVKRITPYLNGKLNKQELVSFLDHVKSCDSCHSELETWYMMDQTIRGFQGKQKIRYDMRGLLDEKIDAQLKAIRRAKLFRRWFAFVAGVTVLLVLFFVLYYFNLIPHSIWKGLL